MEKLLERKSYLVPFIGLFAAISILLSIISIGISHFETLNHKNELNYERSFNELQRKITSFNKIYENYADILSSLSTNKLLKDYLQNKNSYTSLYTAQNLFSVLIEHDKNVMQLRYINKEGEEKIRYERNYINSSVVHVPQERLQNKKDSYYFKESIKLKKGEIYTSKVDLNKENGQIEIPNKSTLRIAIPIVENGLNNGILVINIFMNDVLKEITTSSLFYNYLYDQEHIVFYSNNENYVNWPTKSVQNDAYIAKQKWIQSDILFKKNNEQTIYLGLELKEPHDILKIFGTVFMNLALFILPISIILGYLLSRIPKTLFDNLEAQQKLMIKQSKFVAMGEMVESLAHQWRQPLNAIGLLTQEINLNHKMDTLDKDTMESLNKDIGVYLNNMSVTIDNFRSFFKPQCDKCEFDMLECINDAVNIIKPKLDENKISIHIIDQNNTKKPKPYTLNGYKNEVTQSILSLIRNSTEAIEKSNKKVKNINIFLQRDTSMLTVTIQDNGCGIKPKLFYKIFEPYYSTKENKLQGSGLGLYIVKNIIEGSMKGKIVVESNERDGSKFELKIPIN